MDRLSETAEASHKALEEYRRVQATNTEGFTPKELALLEVKAHDLWSEYRELWELSLVLARDELNKAA